MQHYPMSINIESKHLLLFKKAPLHRSSNFYSPLGYVLKFLGIPDYYLSSPAQTPQHVAYKLIQDNHKGFVELMIQYGILIHQQDGYLDSTIVYEINSLLLDEREFASLSNQEKEELINKLKKDIKTLLQHLKFYVTYIN